MKKSIFLLDDNVMALDQTVEALKKEFQVTSCREILSAKRRLSLYKYDLIIIDLMMPTRGLANDDEIRAGLSFYEEYVAIQQKGVPVLFWTSLTKESFDSFLEGKKNEGLNYVQKGDGPASLIREIHKILD